VPDATAKTCARALIDGWVARFGVPTSIVSDRGRQFCSLLWSSLASMLGYEVKQTTAYNPAANGMVERLHRTLKAALRARLVDSSWPMAIGPIMLAVRTAAKGDIGVSPAEMVYGVPLRLPASFVAPGSNYGHSSADEFVRLLRDTINDKVFVPATWHGVDSSKRALKGLDCCSHVWERVDCARKPLDRPYRGPFKVLNRGDKCFTIEKSGKSDVVSIDRLKPAYTLEDVLGDVAR